MKTISSNTHPVVQHLVKLQTNSRYRKEQGTLILEGRNCIYDVCKKLPAKKLLLGPDEPIPKGILADETIHVTRAIIEKISTVENPDNILVELTQPTLDHLPKGTHFIALDRIQDPGNLGTLIRTALALGWDGVFIIQPACDPFNDKALRAAKGATFMLPIQIGSWNDLEKLIARENLSVVAADLDGKMLDSFPKREKLLLVLGNEAQGVTIPNTCIHETVCIPMQSAIDSLNVAVAGGIVMYALRPQ